MAIKDCNFCLENKILRGGVLAQDDFCYIVESIDPVLQNAVLIITKRHIETPFEINEQEWASMRKYLLEAKKILSKANPDGFIIGWNVGEVAGQRVSHAHLHVVARFSDEPLVGKGICYFFKQEENKRRGK
ncbi:MAG: HIT domain-containing protein [bacterium]